MITRTVTIAVTLTLQVDETEVNDTLLERYLDKAIDNGIDNGLDASIGVTVVEQETQIQLNPDPRVCGFELPDGSTAHYEL